MKKFKIYLDKFHYLDIVVYDSRNELQIIAKDKTELAGVLRNCKMFNGEILGKVADVRFSFDDMDIITIMHEALHIAIFYFTGLFHSDLNIPSEYFQDKKTAEHEEDFVVVSEKIFEKILKGLKNHDIKIKGL